MKKQTRSLPVWLLLFFLSLSLLLAWIFNPQIKEYIVSPLSAFIQYALWLAGLLGKALDQYLIWGTFVILSSIAAIVSLTKSWQPRVSDKVSTHSHGGISVWIRRLELLEKGIYFRWRLSQEIAPILVNAIGYTDGLTQKQTRTLIEKKNLDLPENILGYLHVAYSKDAQVFFSTNPLAEKTSSPLKIPLAELLDYFKNELSQTP